jgi:hypothetical protein
MRWYYFCLKQAQIAAVAAINGILAMHLNSRESCMKKHYGKEEITKIILNSIDETDFIFLSLDDDGVAMCSSIADKALIASVLYGMAESLANDDEEKIH